MGWEIAANMIQAGAASANPIMDIYDRYKAGQMRERENERYNAALALDQKRYQEQWDYKKQMDQLQMSREDTSIQRKMKDLIAAGLHPALAAGEGAGAGVSMSAPATGGNPRDRSGYSSRPPSDVNVGSIANQYAMTQAQVELMGAQADLARANAKAISDPEGGRIARNVADIAMIGDKRELIKAQTKREHEYTKLFAGMDEVNRRHAENLLANTNRIEWDLQESQRRGLRTNDSQWMITIAEYLAQKLKNFAEGTNSTLSDIVNKTNNRRLYEQYRKWAEGRGQIGENGEVVPMKVLTYEEFIGNPPERARR